MGNEKQKILVVDDDVNVCELVRLYLTKNGYDVVVAHNGKSAEELFLSHSPSLVIMDIMMPGVDGISMCRKFRSISKTPVIMLTAKGETYDKVSAFDAGADDYMVKPFDAKELVARVGVVLKRCGVSGEITAVSEIDGIKIDMANHTAEISGKPTEMPPKELELLYYLISNPNKAFSREQLLNEVWGFNCYVDTRTVDVHIKRIREKIEGVSDKWELKTVWGIGYKLEVK